MKKKSILILVISSIIFIGSTFASKLVFEPIFSEDRFPPTDKLHIWCSNEIDLAIVADQNDINAFRIIVNYNPKELQIQRITPASWFQNAMNSTIEYDKIIINFIDSNPIKMGKNNLLKIYTKSTGDLTQSLLSIANGSYTVNKQWTKKDLSWFQNIFFSKVPECNPDIVPPAISLINPENTKQKIALDSFFVFDIKDEWKWVDRNKLKVKFNEKEYLPIDKNIIVKEWKLYFYPEDRLPIDQKIDVKVTISDKQEYGWANESSKTFSFKTATWMLLQSNINPNTLRKIYELSQKILWSTGECNLLTNLENTISKEYKMYISSISDKLSCPKNIWTGNLMTGDIILEKTKKSDSISLLGAIWWTLFFITFLLKLHYIVEYKRHKKIVKHMKKD